MTDSRGQSTISILLFLLLAAFILASCAPNSATPAPTAESTPQPTRTQSPRRTPTRTATAIPTSYLDVDPADLEGLKILFWHPFSAPEANTLATLVAEFNRQNAWGITVQAVSLGSYDRLAEQMSAALEEGELPHLILSYPHQALTWEASHQLLVPLDVYLDDPVWGLSPQDQSDFIPAFWEQEAVAGERLGLPAIRYAQVIYYNVTWARELGFPSPPVTPAQFELQACAAARFNNQDADRQNDSTGGYLLSSEYNSILGWLHAFGAEIVQPGGKGYRFDSLAVERAFAFLRQLYDKGCAQLAEGKTIEDEFATRRALFAPGSLAGIVRQEAVFADLGSTDEWTVIPFPSPVQRPGILTYGPSLQVLQSSPAEQLASWLLLKWLISPQSQARLAQAVQAYPTRRQSLDQLAGLTAVYPQWQQALDLLDSASPEPSLASWRIVRWAVSDAATQLTRYYFSIDQVPQLVRLLDETANALHQETH